jgi:hypothetical protein
MEKRLTEKALHEPLSNYVAGVYNTLGSVVQGVALGALFYVLTEMQSKGRLDLANSVKCVVVVSLIALLWHRYAVHNQFAVWRLEIQDTLIPIGFTVLQLWLALAVPEHVAWFAAALSAISLLGALAYWNTTWRYNKPESLELFREHFSEEDPDFSRDLRDSINSFQKLSILLTFISATVMGELALINFSCDFLDEDGKTYVTVVVAEAIIGLSFRYDLRWWLNHRSGSRISRYVW